MFLNQYLLTVQLVVITLFRLTFRLMSHISLVVLLLSARLSFGCHRLKN